jgi:6-phosphogluconate dehydrogenase (decarboxylating)
VSIELTDEERETFVPTVAAARDLLTALFSRFGSRDLDHFANHALSAMRSQFGRHVEKSAG